MLPNLSRATRVFAGILALELVLGLYGLDQPIRWGHQGWHVGEHGLGARNLSRHGSLVFTAWHGVGAPPRSSASFHHPTMLQVPVAAVQAAFGEEPWTVRVVSLAFSLFALTGLFALVRATRSPRQALVASGIFVLHPTHVAFSNLPDVEIVAIGFALWAALAWHRFLQAPGRRRALVFLGAVSLAAFSDWPFFPIAFFWFVGEAVIAVRADPALRRSALLALAVASLAILAVLGQHLLRAYAAGALDNLLGAYEGRKQPIDAALVARQLASLQSLVLLGLGGVWLLTGLRRWRQDVLARFVLAVLVGQSLYLARFGNEFSFHEYRSHWYAAPLAVAASDVLAGLDKRRWIARGATALVLAALALGAARMLVVSRARSGSINERHYRPNTSLYLAARILHELAPAGTRVVVGPGVPEDRLELFWSIDRPSFPVRAASDIPERAFLLERARTVGRYRAWRARARRGSVLLFAEWAIADLTGRWPPSVEHARLVRGPRWSLPLRYLRAPLDRPWLLSPGDPAHAAAMAGALGASADVLARAAAGRAPMWGRLSRELRTAH